MKIKWKLLLACIAVPLLVGGLAGFVSGNGMRAFETLNRPPLSPPGWLFPVVWTILYIGMGIASYLVIASGAPQKPISRAALLYGLQLFFNFLWPILFFNLQLYFFAFAWLVCLWCFILATGILFLRVAKPAAYLMAPYLLWVAFAGYLNLGISLMN